MSEPRLLVQEHRGIERTCSHSHWLIRCTKSAIILQSAWSGQDLYLLCPQRERSMHPRDCGVAEGAGRVA